MHHWLIQQTLQLLVEVVVQEAQGIMPTSFTPFVVAELVDLDLL